MLNWELGIENWELEILITYILNCHAEHNEVKRSIWEHLARLR